MIFHRLALHRIIEYLGMTNLFGDHEKIDNSEISLKTNEKMNMILSVLMSVLGTLICLTLPFVALERPSEAFANTWPEIHDLMKWVENNMEIIDRIIIATAIVLVYVAAFTILDAIRNTNIKVSPWVQKGKYLPRKYIRNVQIARPCRIPHGY